MEDRKGRQKSGCGHPPSIARSQKTRGGIFGEMQTRFAIRKKRAALMAALFYLICAGPTEEYAVKAAHGLRGGQRDNSPCPMDRLQVWGCEN